MILHHFGPKLNSTVNLIKLCWILSNALLIKKVMESLYVCPQRTHGSLWNLTLIELDNRSYGYAQICRIF